MSIRAPSMQKYSVFVSFPSFVTCTSRYHTRLQQRDFDVKKKTCSFWVETQLEGKIGSHCLLDCIFILASYLSYFILFLYVWKGTPPCQAKILTLFSQHFCQFFCLNQPLLWTSIYFTRCSGRSFCLQSLVWQWPQLCLV